MNEEVKGIGYGVSRLSANHSRNRFVEDDDKNKMIFSTFLRCSDNKTYAFSICESLNDAYFINFLWEEYIFLLFFFFISFCHDKISKMAAYFIPHDVITFYPIDCYSDFEYTLVLSLLQLIRNLLDDNWAGQLVISTYMIQLIYRTIACSTKISHFQ